MEHLKNYLNQNSQNFRIHRIGVPNSGNSKILRILPMTDFLSA